MDRESLARRNMNEAQALHQPSTLHTFRGAFLSFLAKLPVLPQRPTADRLLVIRPDHLGDVLLMMPAIRLIKLQRPDTELHVICGTWAAELLAPFDEIDLVLTLEFPGFQRQRVSATRNPYLIALDSARMLREIGYGSALVMRPDHWWGAMLAFLAGIPERIGYDNANVAPFLTGRLPYQQEHAILQNMRLAQFWLGIPPGKDINLTLPVNPADIVTVDQLLSDRQIAPDQPVVCIHPGSGMPSKLWQCEKWAAVADQIAQLHAASIVFTGSAAESALINDIVERMKAKAHSVAGATLGRPAGGALSAFMPCSGTGQRDDAHGRRRAYADRDLVWSCRSNRICPLGRRAATRRGNLVHRLPPMPHSRLGGRSGRKPSLCPGYQRQSGSRRNSTGNAIQQR